MNLPADFQAASGQTLFMAAANRQAMLITRTGKRMRRRALDFADEHAALNWALKHRATFLLTHHPVDLKLN